MTITQDNYDDTETPVVVDNDTLEAGWWQITIGKEIYSVTTDEMIRFCRAFLSASSIPIHPNHL